MLSSEEKNTLLKAIEEIKYKSVTLFGNFECKDVAESTNFTNIFLSMVDFTDAIKNVEELVKRY